MSDSIEITIPDPAWGSKLANIILDLEKLRSKKLYGEVPPHIFFQLKEIFQILETLGSARIEGNKTTLTEYVEKLVQKRRKKEESAEEVANLDRAISFIEKNIDTHTTITRMFISELHKIVVKDLTPPPEGEGSKNPGGLRKHNVSIQNATHKPPDFAVLPDHFDEFLRFINADHLAQYQLLMVAVAHHRFAYMHPFDKGNGRVGRLLNYALLIKMGFRVKDGRVINPSSVFYADRDKYYDMLGQTDSLIDTDILAWVEYFLLGLKNEIEKVDSLLSRDYVQTKILLPAVDLALDRKIITAEETKVLDYLIRKPDMLIKSEELAAFGLRTSLQKSRFMSKLRQKGIIVPIKKEGRIYTLSFVNNYLLRGIIDSLTKEGFVADFLNRN